MNDLCDNLQKTLILVGGVFVALIVFSGLLIFGVGQVTVNDFKNLVTALYIALIVLFGTITLGISAMTLLKIKGLIIKLGELK